MDIVEKLREHNEPPFDYIAHEAANQIVKLREALLDAAGFVSRADTIEQLRGQVDFERKCREDTYADLEKQDAEIERLRGMLIFALDGLDEYWVTFPEGVELVNQIKALQQKEKK